MGGRGREGEPIEWTGSVPLVKRVTEENPGRLCVTPRPSEAPASERMTAGTSLSNRTEVTTTQAAQKSR